MAAKLRTRRQAPPRIYDGPIRGKKAWTRTTISKGDYLHPIPNECLKELKEFVQTLRLNPIQTEVLSYADYKLHKTRAFMSRVRKALEGGVGFAVIDRLPVRIFDKSELTAIYWVISSMIARPVAQSFTGTLLYDVIDKGKIKSPKVRADITRAELDFHTDYSYNQPPRFFGLQALRTAKKGGRSSAASLMSAHNEMRSRHPRLLARLYQPFWLNRYGEHAPGDSVASFHPVYSYNGKELSARFNPRNIYAGYDLMGETLDAEGADAVEALHNILEEPNSHLNFHLVAGQTVYFLNGACAHRRTAYEDHADPDRKRHMVRIFLRDEGARTYNG